MTLTQWQTQRDRKALPNLVRTCVAADVLGISLEYLEEMIRGSLIKAAFGTEARVDFIQYPSLDRLARIGDLTRRQQEYDRLPLLMRAGQFAAIAGVSVSTVHRWVSHRKISICIPPGRTQGMHYKSELCRITGFQF